MHVPPLQVVPVQHAWPPAVHEAPEGRHEHSPAGAPPSQGFGAFGL